LILAGRDITGITEAQDNPQPSKDVTPPDAGNVPKPAMLGGTANNIVNTSYVSYNPLARSRFALTWTGTIGSETLEGYWTVTNDGVGKYLSHQGEIPTAGYAIQRAVYVLAKGQGNNADTYTQPAGVQPTQGDSLNDTLALIQTYMNRIGTDSSYTFLITYDEVSVFTGILDSYPGAAAAYSLRKLDKDYTGYAIKVRESAGNTLADIGFDSNGDLDTTALLAHTGPADGYVQTWYDQSGNGNNASQGTNADQPKIVSSGSVITENGKPAVQFNGAGDLLQNSSVPTGTIFTADAENTIVAVMYQDGSQTSNVLISNNSTTDIFTVWATQGTSNNLIYDVGNSGNNRLLYSYGGATTFEDVQNLLFWSSSATLQQICVNGTQLASGTAPDTITLSSTILRIGSRYSTYLVGSIQELIVYPSDEASNRTGIESNVNTYYSIY